MRLVALDDKGGWGRAVVKEAQSRKWPVALLKRGDSVADAVGPSYAFMRLAQDQKEREADLLAYANTLDRNFTMIPEPETALCYEDKWEQVKLYRNWMPDTVLADGPDVDVPVSGYPFISKSKTGSASRNVRLIRDENEARAEIECAFSNLGIGGHHHLGERMQRGYLIWQEFLPDNDYDYRVCAVGSQRMMLKRWNKPGTPFASGSGVNEPVTELTGDAADAMDFANEFFAARNLNWCGIDLVYDRARGQWRLLETTLGWKQSAYDDCVFWPSERKGKEIWSVLLDEIETGAFAGRKEAA